MRRTIYITILLLALAGCKSKQVTKQSEVVQLEQREVQATAVELRTDSTTHVYTIERIKVYNPDTGKLEREEERTSGEVKNAIKVEREEDKQEATERTSITRELDEDKATGASAPTPPSTIANNLINKVAWSLIIGGVLVLLIITIRKYYVQK